MSRAVRAGTPCLRDARAALLLAALLSAGACDRRDRARAASSPAPPDTTVAYRCDDVQIAAQYAGDSLRLLVPGLDVLHLPHVVSADGARYSDGSTTFWNVGRTARLELPAVTYQRCTELPHASPWDAARLRGARFRAVGTEPGWTLELGPGSRVSMVADYGARRATLTATLPATDSSADRTVYHAVAPGHTLVLTLQGRTCGDGMSDMSYPTTVVAVLDGRTYRGCGRALLP